MARLYRPGVVTDESPEGGSWPHLEEVMSAKTIDWDLITRHYDQMIKYATALRLGTAQSHQMLRPFTRGGPKHPTYQAIEELGRAIRTMLQSIRSLGSVVPVTDEAKADRDRYRLLDQMNRRSTSARSGVITGIDLKFHRRSKGGQVC